MWGKGRRRRMKKKKRRKKKKKRRKTKRKKRRKTKRVELTILPLLLSLHHAEPSPACHHRQKRP